MRRYSKFALFAIAFLFLGLGLSRAGMVLIAPAGIELESESAPDFVLKGLGPETVSLSDYKDKKAVILFFWTTWCRFCQDELRSMVKRYDTIEKESIGLISINTGEPKSIVDGYLRNLGVGFPVFLDTDNYVARLYGVPGVPTYIFVNKKGDIVSRRHSFPQDYKDILRE